MARREKKKQRKDAAAQKDGAQDQEAPTKKSGGKGAWKLLDRGSSIAAGLLAREVSQVAWRIVTGKKPPTNGRHPEVETREAVAWAIVGGALVELVKVLVRRYASDYWVRSTGELPPGMKTLKEPEPEPEPVADAPSRRSRRRSGRRKG